MANKVLIKDHLKCLQQQRVSGDEIVHRAYAIQTQSKDIDKRTI